MTERQSPQLDWFDLDKPLKSIEIAQKADVIATSLIQDPRLLTDVSRALELSQAEDDAAILESRGRLLTEIARRIDRYDWSTQEYKSLGVDSAYALLMFLPTAARASRRNTPQEQIAQNLTKGYLNTRFEASYNWRESLKTQRIVLEAAVENGADLELLDKWFDLVTGQYTNIAPTGSLPWRSKFLGARVTSPAAESILKIAAEMNGCEDIIAELLHRREDFKRSSRNYNALNIQFAAAEAVLEAGLDPRYGQGKGSYELTIRTNIPREFLMGASQADLRSLSRRPLRPDVFEVAYIAYQYPNRYLALTAAINEGFSSGQAADHSMHREGISIGPDGKPAFPYSVYSQSSPLLEKIRSLLDPEQSRSVLHAEAQRTVEEREGSWELIPFALRGLYGLAIVPKEETTRSKQEKLAKVDELIAKHQVVQRVQNNQYFSVPNVASYELDLGECSFLILKPELAAKTQLEVLMDIRIPDDIRQESLKILWSNMNLRRELPARFRRVPTKAGDRYDLTRHPDMPNLIRQVVIKKGPIGGLEFSFEFETDEAIFPNGERLTAHGTTNFEFGRVNIRYENLDRLSVDQQWILENVLLHLIDRSCCPTLQEVDEEIEEITKETREMSLKSVPGYIGHIGGFRSSGERKQFTQRAQENFSQIVAQLYGDTQGVSLITVNEKHRGENPEDDRFLTYYKGKDTDELDLEPTPRRAPAKILTQEG